MQIKLIAADMDGTLLTTDQKITPRVEAAIKDAAANGAEFVVASGRSFSECESYCSQLDARYFILANGAYIWDHKDKKDLFSLTISPAEAVKIYEIYAKYENLVFVQIDHWVYTQNDFNTVCMTYPEYAEGLAPIDLPYRYVDDMGEFLRRNQQKVEKFHTSFMRHEDGVKAYEELSRLPYNVVWCGKYCVEVTHPDADKGRALQMLAERLGFKRGEVMAMGDSGNDFSMLEYAGISVVVDNGSEDVKAIADMIAPSHDEDGVAEAMEKYL